MLVALQHDPRRCGSRISHSLGTGPGLDVPFSLQDLSFRVRSNLCNSRQLLEAFGKAERELRIRTIRRRGCRGRRGHVLDGLRQSVRYSSPVTYCVTCN